MLKPAVQGLRSSVDRVMSQREQYIDKFCRFLDKDIVALRKELKGIKNEAQVLLLHINYIVHVLHVLYMYMYMYNLKNFSLNQLKLSTQHNDINMHQKIH